MEHQEILSWLNEEESMEHQEILSWLNEKVGPARRVHSTYDVEYEVPDQSSPVTVRVTIYDAGDSQERELRAHRYSVVAVSEDGTRAATGNPVHSIEVALALMPWGALKTAW